MPKFIKLTEQSNDKIHYINVNSINHITKDDNDTIIRIKEEWLYFKESPEEIMKLINSIVSE